MWVIFVNFFLCLQDDKQAKYIYLYFIMIARVYSLTSGSIKAVPGVQCYC